jgi:hypothetical protein
VFEAGRVQMEQHTRARAAGQGHVHRSLAQSPAAPIASTAEVHEGGAARPELRAQPPCDGQPPSHPAHSACPPLVGDDQLPLEPRAPDDENPGEGPDKGSDAARAPG